MDDSTFRRFFLEPDCPRQRQYEALRAVFVDDHAQKDVAQRFGYSYQAFRQLVFAFRQRFTVEGAPPFSTNQARDDHASNRGAQGRFANGLPRRPSRRSPTRGN